MIDPRTKNIKLEMSAMMDDAAYYDAQPKIEWHHHIR
jgi:hypothetical protein